MVVGGCGSIHPRKRDAGIGAAMAPVPALSLPLSTVEAPIKSTNKRRQKSCVICKGIKRGRTAIFLRCPVCNRDLRKTSAVR